MIKQILSFMLGLVAIYNCSQAQNIVNPNANAETKAVKAYLDQVYGKKIISGQAFENVNENWLNIIQNASGKQPAILGLDFMNSTYERRTNHGADPNAMTDKAIDWYKNKHGLVEFHWHWDAPKNVTGIWYSAFYTSATSFDINYAVNNQNSTDFQLLVRDIDDIAAHLKRLQDNGVPVIWRPLHEAEGGWFWWGAKDGASCQKLWNYMYDRLVNHHQLNNLIWVWNSYGGGNKGNWYPGDKTVDIIAWDYESGNSWNSYQQLFGGKGKLFALGEEGKLPDPNNFAARPWLYFLTWAYMIQNNNDANWINKVYNDPKTITLSDLPWPWVKDVVANAGPDQVLITTNLSTVVGLDGSGSSSVNSAITSYVWKENNVQIATGVKPQLSLSLGKHTITLVITDANNKTATDEVVIHVKKPNLALNKTVTVSSTEANLGNIASNATDGKTDTRWSSLYADPQWIKIDLGAPYVLENFSLMWEVAFAKSYVIEVSMDDANWTQVMQTTTGDGGTDDIAITPTSAQYVRLTSTARATTYGNSLYEFEVYGSDMITALDSEAGNYPKLNPYPNPFQDRIYLNLPANTEVELSDMNGMLLYRGSESSIETGALSKGLYLLKIKQVGGTQVVKMSKN